MTVLIIADRPIRVGTFDAMPRPGPVTVAAGAPDFFDPPAPRVRVATGLLGLGILIGESTIAMRHHQRCRPGFWAIGHYSIGERHGAPWQAAVVDDYGTLVEVAQ